ncbi:thioredoxin family protein [candidate division WWE3 bacterium]|uniref:Thioredoxin family protein n=1 Tax=candidate division WWE3 bacterium TaxID=2053526 RepID=A0A955LFT3_UNCKA|nr:thioredoxin family protein [candidate division WWE3 bacterium]
MLKLIDYYADWCGPCQQMKPAMHEVEEEFSGKMQFQQIDVDQEEHREQVQAAGVMSIPTFAIVRVDEKGEEEEIDRKLGAMPKDALVSWLNEHLEKEPK